MNKTIVAGIFSLSLVLPVQLDGQVRSDLWQLDRAPVATEVRHSALHPSELADVSAAHRRGFGGHPWLRTLATVAAATGGYALADEYLERGESDVRYGPIAAGAGAGALAGMLLSTGHPAKILLGAALSTLPSAALSTFVANAVPEEEQGQLPLITFGIPQGLLTSAFAQDRR